MRGSPASLGCQAAAWVVGGAPARVLGLALPSPYCVTSGKSLTSLASVCSAVHWGHLGALCPRSWVPALGPWRMGRDRGFWPAAS